MFGFLALTALVGVLTLALWGNQPWFLLPWSFCLIAGALFHSRLTGMPTHIVASWYPVVVLYNVATPQENFYTALWVVPIMGGMGTLLYLAVQTTIKPQDPLKLLHAALIQQFKAVEGTLARRLKGRLSEHRERRPAGSPPGNLTRNYELLSHCVLVHPSLRRVRDAYEALLVEVNGLGHLAAWYETAAHPTHWATRLGRERRREFVLVIKACRKLRRGIADARDVSAEALAMLAQIQPTGPEGHEVPSLLRALQGSEARIAKLLWVVDPTTPPRPHSARTSPTTAPRNSLAPAWMGYPFWYANRETLLFALKFAFAAMLCALIVQALDWPGVSTAIVTSVVLAQTSLGANYRKSLLRFSGAALGGLLAYAYVLLAQPVIDTLVGFAVLTTPAWALAAWIAAGGARTSYIGQQIGYAFGIFVLHDFGQVTDLLLSRDRVLGILLGVLVVGVLDYILWPRRSNKLAQRRVATAFHALAGITAWPATEAHHMQRQVLPVRRAVDKDLAAALGLLSEAEFEPDAASGEPERQRLRTLVENANELAGLLSIRVRYRLVGGLVLHELPEGLRGLIAGFDGALEQALISVADALQGRAVAAPPPTFPTLERLETQAHEWYGTARRTAEIGRAVELRMSLDRQIVQRIEGVVAAVFQGQEPLA